MGNMTIAATFVIILNVLMWLGQVAILDINPTGTEFIDLNNGMVCELGNCNNLTLPTGSLNDQLPKGEGSISATTGNLFTDIFSSIKTWFGSVTGLRYLGGILAAPYTMLKAMSLPAQFVFAVGSLWYGITLFVIIAFIFGRE